MRFFKAFNLLHRRTKSDSFVSGSAFESVTTDSEPPSRRSSVPVSLFDLVTSQIPANFKHLSDRGPEGSGASVTLPVFGLEKEMNARLIDANNRWAKEYSNIQCQLKECRQELHAERRKVQCLQHKLEEDNRIIFDLHMLIGRFEGLLDLSNHPATGSSQDTISGGAGVLLNVSARPNFVKSTRTMDEYLSALRMTLDTRKKLRDQKKVALFWKRKALDNNELHSSITPSVSTISSIHDPLPVDRQIALDALISRRNLHSTFGDQIGWKDTFSGSPKALVSKLPTCEPADEIDSPIAIARLPAMSSENSPSSRLGPLASESIKAEVNSLLSSSNSVKYPIPQKRRESSRSSSLIERLAKLTSATSTPSKKTDLMLDADSFGDLHVMFAVRHSLNGKIRWLTAILQPTFGVDKLLVDESNATSNRIDMEDDLSISMTSVLPPPTSVPVSLGLPSGSVFRTSNIPTRRVVVTSRNEVTANTLKQVSKDCTSRRSWQRYKARPATTTKVKTGLEGNVSPKRVPGSHKAGKDKENTFARGIPIFKRKTLSQNGS